jgi:hypothetical protein
MVMSPRSVGCFSRRERSAHIWIHTGRASNAEKQPTGRGPEIRSLVSSSMREGAEVRIERGLIFKDAEDDADEFVHDGTADGEL